MKIDKLEKFIIENRAEFDILEPDDSMWEKINKPVSEPKIKALNWKTIVLRVAAVVLIFVASYYFHDFMNDDNNSHVVVMDQKATEEESEQIQVLMEAEVFYTSQINFTKGEISRLSDNDPILIEDIDYDLQELEKVFRELKNDLKDNGDNEEVIEAMIQNYRIKLQLLEEILTQIQNSKQVSENENKRHEI